MTLNGAPATSPSSPEKPYRVAVFASGAGSNFQAVAAAAANGKLGGAAVELLVCDRPKAPVVDKARRAGIEAFVFRPKDYASREHYEAEILQLLRERHIDLVVLAGYMRMITNTLVQPYCGRMINVHPSLLPAFPGLNAIGQALAHGVKVTGVTVHYVDGGMDTGAIIAQRAIEIFADDTEATLASRIHPIEHELLIHAICGIRRGEIDKNLIREAVLWPSKER
jgi:phosphoribosylglycinamide formyltransferase-1